MLYVSRLLKLHALLLLRAPKQAEMSVMCESSAGWLLDELRLINKWYHKGEVFGAAHCWNPTNFCETLYSFREDFFMIFKPHITSQTSLTSSGSFDPDYKDLTKLSNSTTSQSKTVKKKRKQSNAFNQGELDAMEYHKKISHLISEGSQPLIEEGLKKGFLQQLSESEDKKAKIIPGECKNNCGLADLCDMAKHIPFSSEHTVQLLSNETLPLQDTDLLNNMTENNTDRPQIINLLGEKYLVPPKSRFLLSDITCLESLLQCKRRYNIIIIDPPWENKSVKRSKRYNYLSTQEIKQLPIPALAASSCLVITWVTNRQKHLKFVKEELYPYWGVKTLTEWHWVKITRCGEFVFPLDSAHKKPYEILVLGQTQATDNLTTSETEMETLPIPQHKLIISVPCTLHSHKPPLSGAAIYYWELAEHIDKPMIRSSHQSAASSKLLTLKRVRRLARLRKPSKNEVLKEYVKPNAECLELFARNLQPRWTSWGNEVLKFQHMDYFVPLEISERTKHLEKGKLK